MTIWSLASYVQSKTHLSDSLNRLESECFPLSLWWLLGKDALLEGAVNWTGYLWRRRIIPVTIPNWINRLQVKMNSKIKWKLVRKTKGICHTRINSINEGHKEIEGTQINRRYKDPMDYDPTFFPDNTSHLHEDLQDCIWYTGLSQLLLDWARSTA